jgi:hypothetical protein
MVLPAAIRPEKPARPPSVRFSPLLAMSAVVMVNGTVWLIWIVLIEERSFFAVSLVVAIRDAAG